MSHDAESNPTPAPGPYLGQYVHNAHFNRMELPSRDIAAYINQRHSDFKRALLLGRTGKPKETHLYRVMPEGTLMVPIKGLKFCVKEWPSSYRPFFQELIEQCRARFKPHKAARPEEISAGDAKSEAKQRYAEPQLQPETDEAQETRDSEEPSDAKDDEAETVPPPHQHALVRTFSFEGKDIRTVLVDGVMYWVGKDVCDRLGYEHDGKAYAAHCKGVAIRHTLQTAGGKQKHRVLTESDMFRLIVGSELPDAERFRVWLFEDVLPSIRKTGSYGPRADAPMSDDDMISRSLQLVHQRLIAITADNATLNETVMRQDGEIEKHKARAEEIAARITDGSGHYHLEAFARDYLNLARYYDLADQMKRDGLLKEEWNEPTQRFVRVPSKGPYDLAYLTVEMREPPGLKGKKVPVVLVTEKGQRWLILKYWGSLRRQSQQDPKEQGKFNLPKGMVN